jgi:hypothetical protein
MPKSRVRKNGKKKFVSKADIAKINNAYLTKFEEYEKLELSELLEIEKSNKVKGTYLLALKMVIKVKQQPKKEAA